MKHPIRTPREFVSNIVVVDSQPQDYETLIARASDWSYQFQVFTSGSQAMQASLALFDGLWLINTRLSDMSGIELLLLIREPRSQRNHLLGGRCISARRRDCSSIGRPDGLRLQAASLELDKQLTP